MPSLQQQRYEAFADRVEQATRSSLFGTVGAQQVALQVRVETQSGVSIDLQLMQVDVDGQHLVGRSPTGAPLRFPLDHIKTVRHRWRDMGRALSVWFATLLASTTIGLVGATATGWGSGMQGALLGALLGSIAGIGVMVLVDKWEALYKWVPLYDRDAAVESPEF